MIYLFSSDDISSAREKAEALLDTLRARGFGSAYDMDADTWNSERFLEFVHGSTLFGGGSVVILASVLRNEDTKSVIIGEMKGMKASANVFVFVEGALDAKTRSAFERHAEQVWAGKEKRPAAREFNIFPLADALGNRDKKAAWLVFQSARREGVPAENIYGVLFWQVKTILIAKSAAPGEKTGLKPFVLEKAKRFAKNFTLSELRLLSSSLVSLYHDSRKGAHDLDVALERFILVL